LPEPICSPCPLRLEQFFWGRGTRQKKKKERGDGTFWHKKTARNVSRATGPVRGSRRKKACIFGVVRQNPPPASPTKVGEQMLAEEAEKSAPRKVGQRVGQGGNRRLPVISAWRESPGNPRFGVERRFNTKRRKRKKRDEDLNTLQQQKNGNSESKKSVSSPATEKGRA